MLKATHAEEFVADTMAEAVARLPNIVASALDVTAAVVTGWHVQSRSSDSDTEDGRRTQSRQVIDVYCGVMPEAGVSAGDVAIAMVAVSLATEMRGARSPHGRCCK